MKIESQLLVQYYGAWNSFLCNFLNMTYDFPFHNQVSLTPHIKSVDDDLEDGAKQIMVSYVSERQMV